MGVRSGVDLWVGLRRVADAEEFLPRVPAVDGVDALGLVVDDAALDEAQHVRDVGEGQVAQQDRTWLVAGVDELAQRGVQLERRAREVDELRRAQRRLERPVQLRHARHGSGLLEERRLDRCEDVQHVADLDCVVHICTSVSITLEGYAWGSSPEMIPKPSGGEGKMTASNFLVSGASRSTSAFRALLLVHVPILRLRSSMPKFGRNSVSSSKASTEHPLTLTGTSFHGSPIEPNRRAWPSRMLSELPMVIPKLSMKLTRSSTTSEASMRFLNAKMRKDAMRLFGFLGSWKAGASNRSAVSRVEIVSNIRGSRTGTDRAW